MKHLTNKLKELINKLNKRQADIDYMISLRNDIITDPVKAMANIEPNELVTEDITKFIKILSIPANVSYATNDLVSEVNKVLVKLVDDVKSDYAEAFDVVHQIEVYNEELAKCVKSDDIRAAKDIWSVEANKSLAHSELYEKRLSRAAQVEMGNNDIFAVDYIDWLYGIYEELTLINIETAVDEYDYTTVEKYLAESEGTVAEMKVDDIDSQITDYVGPYDALTNYRKTPEAVLSGVVILTNIVKLLNNYDNHMVYPQAGFNLEYTNPYQVALDQISKTIEKDPLSQEFVDGLLTGTGNAINKLYVAGKYVIRKESIVYENLVVISQACNLIKSLIAGV